MKITNEALIIVDAQRGFMPLNEGERLHVEGFGELGVTGGEKIVSPINDLIRVFQKYGGYIATTQDWHPNETAHFSNNPNYVNTWPIHCVANTPGAELHPELLVAQDSPIATRFIKGEKPASSPEDDTSYTGALSYDPLTQETLPEWLHARKITGAFIVGLALGDGSHNKLCVDSTAADLHEQGFTITLVTDATEAVLPENKELCFKNLNQQGVKLSTTQELCAVLKEKYDGTK